jgi:tRNA (guanine-N7-)-methyltransferase
MHAQPGVRARPDTPVAEQAEQAAPNRRLPASTFRSRHSALSELQRDTWERL